MFKHLYTLLNFKTLIITQWTYQTLIDYVSNYQKQARFFLCKSCNNLFLQFFSLKIVNLSRSLPLEAAWREMWNGIWTSTHVKTSTHIMRYPLANAIHWWRHLCFVTPLYFTDQIQKRTRNLISKSIIASTFKLWKMYRHKLLTRVTSWNWSLDLDLIYRHATEWGPDYHKIIIFI